MTPAQSARVVGVLAVVPAAVFARGLFVVSSQAAARHPVPVITGSTRVHAAPVTTSGRTNPSTDTSPERPQCFGVYAIDRAGGWDRSPSPAGRSAAVAQNFAVGGEPHHAAVPRHQPAA